MWYILSHNACPNPSLSSAFGGTNRIQVGLVRWSQSWRTIRPETLTYLKVNTMVFHSQVQPIPWVFFCIHSWQILHLWLAKPWFVHSGVHSYWIIFLIHLIHMIIIYYKLSLILWYIVTSYPILMAGGGINPVLLNWHQQWVSLCFVGMPGWISVRLRRVFDGWPCTKQPRIRNSDKKNRDWNRFI